MRLKTNTAKTKITYLNLMLLFVNSNVVPGGRVELPCLAAHDFESCVSANSTTRAQPNLIKTFVFFQLLSAIVKRRFVNYN